MVGGECEEGVSWTYYQKSGELFHGDICVGIGYAGKYGGKNNPAMQNVKFTGPLPCGIYRIGDSYNHPRLGPITMDLEPDAANEMFGRDLMRIHGDSIESPGFASDGCIVQGHDVRVLIAQAVKAGDRMLEVKAEREAA